MENQVQGWIVDVTEADFEENVLDRSRRCPVLVDFWAEWCGPCKTLGPILEGLAQEFRGAFVLARVDVERAPSLARNFGVQGIPAVFLFRDGKPVDQFVGLLPESEIRSFIRPHCRTEADRLIEEARRRVGEGSLEEARSLLSQVLESEPENVAALVGLAEVALAEDREEEVEDLLGRVSPVEPEAEPLRARLTFRRLCAESGGPAGVGDGHDRNPSDLEQRYRLGCCLAAQERYREALEIFLGLVSEDRAFRDDGARKAMLEVFKAVGTRSPLADEFRTRLSREIF